ncbi:hypothetical protein KEJ47_09625 [Candidatus Bathyarchaeota archaeon]|nr:hypothetical protein [Candidatus Bathyarchaeota archaeon]
MKLTFFDLETQYLLQELGMNHYNRDPTKLKLAVAGILRNGETSFFSENQLDELLKILNDADLIVGHNLLEFDYLVLEPYLGSSILESLRDKTFDIMLELKKLTGCYISLDDLCRRNLGLSKCCNTLEIPKMWRDGKREEVRDYLLNDLKMTEAIFTHGKNRGVFKYEHKEYGKSLGEREIKVKW